MLKIKGVYDGTKIILLDLISLPPNTAVDIWIPEKAETHEQIYWQHLVQLGLVKEDVVATRQLSSFTPVVITGEPLSKTIIEER